MRSLAISRAQAVWLVAALCILVPNRPAASGQDIAVPLTSLTVPLKCAQQRATGKATVTAQRLGRNRYLVAVDCLPGAYQPSQMFFVWNTSGSPPIATPLEFSVLNAEPANAPLLERTDELWGTSTFDKTTGDLRVLNRFRALGDCGVLTRYRITGTRTTAVEMRFKRDCDGQGADNPGRWPRLNLGALRLRR